MKHLKITRLLGIMTLTALSINSIQAQTQDRPKTPNSDLTQSMNCDSTCITPMLIEKPKVNIATTTKNAGQLPPGAKCGASAGSVVPTIPTSFLCDAGSTPSMVTTTMANGETTYSWSCTNAGGSSTQCAAMQREAGVCGSDNGASLTAPPANQCSSGEGTAYSLVGSTYKWQCKGNYGTPASCSATKAPLCRYVEAGESCGPSIIRWEPSPGSAWICYTFSDMSDAYPCAPVYGPYSCSTNYVYVCN